MRNQEEVMSQIQDLKAQYDKTHMDLSRRDAKALEDKITALQAELQDILTAGANPCPNCGMKPHGMLKSPGNDHAAATTPTFPIYEIGCLGCGPVKKELTPPSEQFCLEVFPLVKGPTAQMAVKAWNEGKRQTKRVEKSV